MKLGLNFKFILTVLFVSLCAIQILGAVNTIAFGARLTNYEKEYNRLSKENEILSESVNKESSLSKIEGKIQQLGYKQPENIFYVKGESFIAKLR